MKILDLSAGNRAMWFDREYPDTTFIDIRPEVEPTIVADTTAPFHEQLEDKFDLIVFDPPFENFGKNNKHGMSRSYGPSKTAQEIRDLIRQTSRNAWHAAKPDALMAFKWSDHAQKLGTVLNLVNDYWEPLFANITSSRLRHVCHTYWVMLRRRSDPCSEFTLES